MKKQNPEPKRWWRVLGWQRGGETNRLGGVAVAAVFSKKAAERTRSPSDVPTLRILRLAHARYTVGAQQMLAL